ncbi:sensor histidine kinase [Sphingomicrobium clamense]|uniref:Histidine kinase n=1 Tax=Sphingomicrobium clamense TaxID=2851013 RepID=A0ABS6V527_9SPHN|nr:histidine kinase [Sphingomicrobium sp. B8]MBW0144639.1 histidine kinase [Sphingomicrobium sp. B8]
MISSVLDKPGGEWRIIAISMAAMWTLYVTTLLVRMALWDNLGWHLVSAYAPRLVSGILLNIVLLVVLRSLSDRHSLPRRALIAAATCLVISLGQATFAAHVDFSNAEKRVEKITTVEGMVIKRKGAEVTVYRGSDDPLTFTFPGSGTGGIANLRTVAEYATVWVFFYAAWSAIYLAGMSAGQVARAQQRLAEAEAAAQSAQVRALRYQINPHFLFNTLNSLSSLVMREDNERAEDMLMALSTFFRTSLSLDPSAAVPLSEEIALQRLYLDIEEVRFPKRLKINIDVPEDVANVTVPALILQPIIENAIKYGVSATKQPVTLSITAHRLDDARVQIDVFNSAPDGKLNNDPGKRPTGTGTGLNNVCQRLETHFAGEADCRFGPVEGGYRVSLAIPDTEHLDD